MNISDLDFTKCAAFGVAGNFTGHLEQAGEAADFKNVQTAEANAPKALFPTYIPLFSEKNSSVVQASDKASAVPAFLHVFPFDSEKIIFPEGEEKLQIEPECALVFKAEYSDEKPAKILSLKPVCFGASNDCSIRKEGAKKISLKKNWGSASKGFSDTLIPLDEFSKNSVINNYRIASFLVRGGKAYDYGEDSAVRNYSYVYEKLNDWIIEKLNNQKDEGPAEEVNAYLNAAGCPEKLMVSIGATRYTSWGQSNFLQKGDYAVVIVYDERKYNQSQIKAIAEGKSESVNNISVLRQLIK